MKTCTKCQRLLETSQFNKRVLSKDGLMPWCKTCTAANAKRWRDETPEQKAAAAAERAEHKSEKLRERHAVARDHLVTARQNAGVKVCYKCKQSKPLDQFGRKAQSPDGLNWCCKKCAVIETTSRVDRDRDGHNVQRRSKYAANPAPHIASTVAYQKRNVELLRQRRKDPETRAKREVTRRKWRSLNAELEHATERARYARNPERERQRAVEWRRKNPGKVRHMNAISKAMRRGAEGTYTQADVDRIYKEQRGRCAYFQVCGHKLGKEYHRDHILSCKDGGTNLTRNIQLTCGPCNLKKKAMRPEKWARRIGLLI